MKFPVFQCTVLVNSRNCFCCVFSFSQNQNHNWIFQPYLIIVYKCESIFQRTCAHFSDRFLLLLSTFESRYLYFVKTGSYLYLASSHHLCVGDHVLAFTSAARTAGRRLGQLMHASQLGTLWRCTLHLASLEHIQYVIPWKFQPLKLMERMTIPTWQVHVEQWFEVRVHFCPSRYSCPSSIHPYNTQFA